MRANEFTESEILDEFSHTDREIHQVLKKKGYKYLGSGVDQTAFIEPGTGYVLKIFGTQENRRFSADHKMFFKWVEFCEKHQDNPFLPRFYGHESFLWKDTVTEKTHRYLMIRTEHLRNSGELGKALAKLTDFAWDDTIEDSYRRFKDENPRAYQWVVSKMSQQNLELYTETAWILHKMGEKKQWGWDLHYGNIMMRNDGTPVINDPWVV